jgi:flagellin
MSGFGDLNRPNTNIQSLDSRLSLNRINRKMADVDLRMATGKRINAAQDDSVGLAISNKLRARNEALSSALNNAGMARDVLGVAESSFSFIVDSLIEMKTTAIRGASDSVGGDERVFLGNQIMSLAENINEIAGQTLYREQLLLKGYNGTNRDALELEFQLGDRQEDTLRTRLLAVNTGTLFNSAGTGNFAGPTQLGKYEDAITVTPLSLITGTNPGQLVIADDATSEDFGVFVSAVDDALNGMINRLNTIGSASSSLGTRELLISQFITSNKAATSRIMDTDVAKDHSEAIRLVILQQTSIVALSQANIGAESVLTLLTRPNGSNGSAEVYSLRSGSSSSVSSGSASEVTLPPPRPPLAAVSGSPLDELPPDYLAAAKVI